MTFISYIIIFSIISGLVSTKPIEENTQNENIFKDITGDEAFRRAEITLNRYYYLMDSDTDQLVHAMLHVIINNPTSFPFVPHRALNIALKNFEKKLGENDVEILIKPILSSIEENAKKKSKQPSSLPLTDEVKDKIENALDTFFEEHV